MKKVSSKTSQKLRSSDEQLTVGLDVGDESTNYCLLDRLGEMVVEGRFATTRAGVSKFIAGW